MRTTTSAFEVRIWKGNLFWHRERNMGWMSPLHNSLRRAQDTRVSGIRNNPGNNSERVQSNVTYGKYVLQTVKNLSVTWEPWFRSLGQEDPLEKGMATHSNILPGESPWTEEPGRLHPMGSERVGHEWATNTFTFGIEKGAWAEHHPYTIPWEEHKMHVSVT